MRRSTTLLPFPLTPEPTNQRSGCPYWVLAKEVGSELIYDSARRFESDATRWSSPRGTVFCSLSNVFAQQSLQLFAQHKCPELGTELSEGSNVACGASVPSFSISWVNSERKLSYKLSARIPRKLKIDEARRARSCRPKSISACVVKAGYAGSRVQLFGARKAQSLCPSDFGALLTWHAVGCGVLVPRFSASLVIRFIKVHQILLLRGWTFHRTRSSHPLEMLNEQMR